MLNLILGSAFLSRVTFKPTKMRSLTQAYNIQICGILKSMMSLHARALIHNNIYNNYLPELQDPPKSAKFIHKQSPIEEQYTSFKKVTQLYSSFLTWYLLFALK